MTKYPTKAEARATEKISIIVAVIRFYCSEKRKAGIEPARASWRELKFSFPRYAAQSLCKITEEELWAHLELMVACGYVRRYNSIRYYTYEVVPEKVNRTYMK